jgi:hypothetical protein
MGLTAMATSAQPFSQSVAALTTFIVLFFLFSEVFLVTMKMEE